MLKLEANRGLELSPPTVPTSPHRQGEPPAGVLEGTARTEPWAAGRGPTGGPSAGPPFHTLKPSFYEIGVTGDGGGWVSLASEALVALGEPQYLAGFAVRPRGTSLQAELRVTQGPVDARGRQGESVSRLGLSVLGSPQP